MLWLVGAGCAPKRVLRQPEPVMPAPPRPSPTIPSGPSVPDAPIVPPPVPPGEPPVEAPSSGHRVAALAQTQLGRPYRWGGNDPRRGFDCSGLVQWSFGNVGIQMPRVVGDQIRLGRSVGAADLLPGDLLFFNLRGNRPSHVGIYVGDGSFVHAPRAGQPVRTDNLDDPYWRRRWSASRRVLDH